MFTLKVEQLVQQYVNWSPRKRPSRCLFIEKDGSPRKVFEWVEDDWQGSLLVLYKTDYENNSFYLCLQDFFGSCTGCDSWYDCIENGGNPQEHVQCALNSINILKGKLGLQRYLNDLPYLHPDCKEKLNTYVNTLST